MVCWLFLLVVINFKLMNFVILVSGHVLGNNPLKYISLRCSAYFSMGVIGTEQSSVGQDKGIIVIKAVIIIVCIAVLTFKVSAMIFQFFVAVL